jgi:hypothetical protein
VDVPLRRHPLLVAPPRPSPGHRHDLLRRHFSGDSTSGYALFYVWVGLYVFYFPVTRRDAALNVLWAFLNYGVVIAITPSAPPGAVHSDVHHFVLNAGTLITAATLLTYLRARVERLLGRLTDAARTDALTGMPNRVALTEALEREPAGDKPAAPGC